jgi:multiple sugar transport system ATP-binding protein
VFLFDEPLSNLDAKLRVQMRVEIARLHERLGATMIYVTHDQVEAMTLGTKVAVMRDGYIHQVATPIELYNHPINKFVAGFIGSPPMNFVAGELQAAAGRAQFASPALSFELTDEQVRAVRDHAGKEVFYGIRPEDIHDRSVTAEFEEADVKELRVEVVEPLGAETLVYLRAPGQTEDIVARFDARSTPRVGETAQVIFDMAKAHLFDAATEESLTYELEQPAPV